MPWSHGKSWWWCLVFENEKNKIETDIFFAVKECHEAMERVGDDV